jgi:DNA-directed RNA polymerase specialized sigma24 family protein
MPRTSAGDVHEGVRGLGPVPARHELNAWLYRIMINTFITGYRRRRAEPPLVAGDAIGWQLPGGRSRVGSAEDQVVGRQLDADLTAAMRALPDRPRAVAYLADVEGCSYRETARAAASVASTPMVDAGTVRQDTRPMLRRAPANGRRAAIRAMLPRPAGGTVCGASVRAPPPSPLLSAAFTRPPIWSAGLCRRLAHRRAGQSRAARLRFSAGQRGGLVRIC